MCPMCGVGSPSCPHCQWLNGSVPPVVERVTFLILAYVNRSDDGCDVCAIEVSDDGTVETIHEPHIRPDNDPEKDCWLYLRSWPAIGGKLSDGEYGWRTYIAKAPIY